ncbi:MAG: hypothetical protein R2804_08210 [Cyclobacteriaceae bacterium]
MKLSQLILLVFLICSIVSCSENEPEPDLIKCNLLKLSREDPNLIANYSHDGQGRIIEILFKENELMSRSVFQYTSDEIKISKSEQSENEANLDILSLSYSIKLNSDGLPISGISPDQTNWFKYFYKDDLLDYFLTGNLYNTVDSLIVTYDETKKNIVGIEFFRLDADGKVQNYETQEYTYDDKANPFYKKYRYTNGMAPEQFFSVNNLIKWGSSTFSYIYNEHNYPIERTRKSSGFNDMILVYEYECD